MTDPSRFDKIGFEDFRARARDTSLSKYEKIAAPDAYRAGKEEAIFADILAKLPALSLRDGVVIDIGCGCTDLPRIMMDHCERQGHHLVMIDSAEMLALLPDRPSAEKMPARFPECEELFANHAQSAGAVIVYAVMQSVFAEGSVWEFVDRALTLLAPGGAMLIGDVPNVSKRKRFFASERGIAFHKQFMETASPPEVRFNQLEPGRIDDAVVLGIVGRARLQGFDAYVVPQRENLPMANRREDILIVRP